MDIYKRNGGERERERTRAEKQMDRYKKWEGGGE